MSHKICPTALKARNLNTPMRRDGKLPQSLKSGFRPLSPFGREIESEGAFIFAMPEEVRLHSETKEFFLCLATGSARGYSNSALSGQ